MVLSSIFKLRLEATPALLELLNNTTLGTNGAKYRHLDTSKRILEADNPLFLSLERNDKVLGNITFCQRDNFWYIRYFAFSTYTQSGIKKKQEDKGNSILKRELNEFFNEVFEGKHAEKQIESMYAYIDPKNDRSKWMSENFGFKVIGQLATQSYSRIFPKVSKRLEIITDWELIKPLVEKEFCEHAYFFTAHIQKGPFYVLKDKEGAILAFSRVTKVNWEIVRLPGKLGGFLVKIIPFIPFINRVLKPKNHTFLVPEIVVAKEYNPAVVNELFSGILAAEKLNLLLWWVDKSEPIYLALKEKLKWGILHKIIGAAPVDVVQLKNPNLNVPVKKPVFVSAFDMV